ncbi:hypothetical protein SLEP1_g15128 [Rubroshorea leprosula]|uniref:Uncharacterized protein n=1 Tax=Rubroshorea leprosula TaxID=152421 RepID=A0AAV5IVS6_9ROSI|nr:hypothetical protein SLEP1_g15128 [Rubroshorea leprosula]
MNAPSYEVHSNISLSYAVSSPNINHDLSFCNGSKTWVSRGTQKLGSSRNLDLGSSRNPEEPIMMKSMVKGMVKMMKRMIEINGHMMMLEDEGEKSVNLIININTTTALDINSPKSSSPILLFFFFFPLQPKKSGNPASL